MKNYTMHTFAHFVQHCLKMYISWILSAFSKHEKFILLHIPCGVLLIKTKLMKSKKAFVLFSLYWKLLSLYSKTVCFTCDGLQIYSIIKSMCLELHTSIVTVWGRAASGLIWILSSWVFGQYSMSNSWDRLLYLPVSKPP